MLREGMTATFDIRAGHSVYLLPSTGSVSVNGARVDALSALSIEEETSITIEALQDSELVLIMAAV